MLEQELASLETFGQVSFDGFFDHARSGKTNKGAGFSNIKIAEHAEAGRDSTKSRIGEQGDIGSFASLN
jgi:hypothetical protein